MLYPGLIDVGETSASSAALDSVAVRRIAEYFCVVWLMRVKARTAWRWGGLKGLGRVWTVILLGRSWLAFWFPLASRQSPVGGLLLPLPRAWGTVACEQRSILTWWLPASTEGLSAGEAGVSRWGWQHLWASLVKFSDSVPLGITELMNLTSSEGSKSTVLVSRSPLEAEPRESWEGGAERSRCGGRRDVGGRELLGRG